MHRPPVLAFLALVAILAGACGSEPLAEESRPPFQAPEPASAVSPDSLSKVELDRRIRALEEELAQTDDPAVAHRLEVELRLLSDARADDGTAR